MNHINVSAISNNTPDATMKRLETFFREHAPEAEMTFSLRAPFDVANLNVGLTLQRDVTARIVPLGGKRRAYAIAWQPADAGPFPAFAGTIFISADEGDETKSIVTLDGHYHPPMGVAGDVFDAVVGKHIAQASASDFLERILLHVNNVVVPVTEFASGYVPVPAF